MSAFNLRRLTVKLVLLVLVLSYLSDALDVYLDFFLASFYYFVGPVYAFISYENSDFFLQTLAVLLTLYLVEQVLTTED